MKINIKQEVIGFIEILKFLGSVFNCKILSKHDWSCVDNHGETIMCKNCMRLK